MAFSFPPTTLVTQTEGLGEGFPLLPLPLSSSQRFPVGSVENMPSPLYVPGRKASGYKVRGINKKGKSHVANACPAPGHGVVGLELTLIGVVSLPASSLSLCNLA